jgi:hypothetical protein
MLPGLVAPHRTIRLPDWEGRLAALIRDARNRRFQTALHDCGTFAADAVAAVTGVDPLAEMRERYRGEAAQPGFAGWSPVAILRALAAAYGWRRVVWRLAQRGDLALVRGADGAACAAVVDLSGRRLMAPGAAGLVAFPLDRASACWRTG